MADSDKRILILTDGKAGHENQSRAFARALGGTCDLAPVKFRSKAAKALFSAGSEDENMPTTVLSEENLADGGIGVIELLVACKLAPSKGEARRLVQQGGIVVNEEKVGGIDKTFTRDELLEGMKIRKGKKVFHKAVLK